MTRGQTEFRPRNGIITGAGSGIGRAVALALAGTGALVHLVGRTREKLDRVAGEVAANGGRAKTHTLDVADDRTIAELVTGFEELDVLIHSAGIYRRGPLAEAPAEDFDQQFAVNVRAPFILTQRLIPALRRASGQVVFINSSAGRRTSPQVGLYSASKFALRALADALRAEENEQRIRVISVYPGRTATPMQEHVHQLENRPYRPGRLLQPEDVADSILAALALPPTAEVTDVSLRPFEKP
ncbi:MAG TPA: SDR family oxidoreductase [Acidimicrobiia bacterium]|jgi:NADP-dependent 3-hydroxy acid dehydrogenase YdfG|nr:SDR family oxidoreductase [Acidimicrobiia bacterium]